MGIGDDVERRSLEGSSTNINVQDAEVTNAVSNIVAENNTDTNTNCDLQIDRTEINDHTTCDSVDTHNMNHDDPASNNKSPNNDLQYTKTSDTSTSTDNLQTESCKNGTEI